MPTPANGAGAGRESAHTRHSVAAPDQVDLSASATRRGCLEADRRTVQRCPTCAGDDVPHRARLSANRRLRRVVRPYAHRDRVLPGPLRAAERGRARADDGPVRPALAAACNLQRGLHLRRRPQRLGGQRPHERAAEGESLNVEPHGYDHLPVEEPQRSARLLRSLIISRISYVLQHSESGSRAAIAITFPRFTRLP